MTKSPHNLSASGSAFGDAVDKRMVTRRQIADIAGACRNTNRAIQSADTGAKPAEDARLRQLRKTRLALKDAIAAALRNG